MNTDLLSELLSQKKLNPEDELPVIDGKQIKSTLRDNSAKLTVLVFLESKSPIKNYIQGKLSPIAKEFTMVCCYLVHIDDNKEIIQAFQLQQAFSLVLFNKEKEVSRFGFQEIEDALTYINEKKPNEPFSGKAHTIGDSAPVDFEEYLKSVRREAPPPPPPVEKPKAKKRTQYPPEVINIAAGLPGRPQQQLQPQQPFQMEPQILKKTRTIPHFLNPFSSEFKSLSDDLTDVGCSPEDITEIVLAGGAAFNECYAYYEAKKEGKESTVKLTNPPTPGPDSLCEEQKSLYEEMVGICDPLQLYYVLLYTGSSDETLILDSIETAQSGEPLPEPIEEESNGYDNNNGFGSNSDFGGNNTNDIQLEVQRLINGPNYDPNSFSSFSPSSDSNAIRDADRYYQEARIKEAEAMKKKRYEDAIAKKKALEAIKLNRENQRKEEEARKSNSSLAHTQPVRPTTASSGRPSTARDVSKIQFRMPSGNSAVFEFPLTSRIAELEEKLKQENMVPAEASVEFDLLPSGRISRDHFEQTLEERRLTGRIAMRVLVTMPQPPAAENVEETPQTPEEQ